MNFDGVYDLLFFGRRKRRLQDYVMREFPAGTKVEMVIPVSPGSPPKYTIGTVVGVDKKLGIIVNWENGTQSRAYYFADFIEKVEKVAVRCLGQEMQFETRARAVNYLDDKLSEELTEEQCEAVTRVLIRVANGAVYATDKDGGEEQTDTIQDAPYVKITSIE